MADIFSPKELGRSSCQHGWDYYDSFTSTLDALLGAQEVLHGVGDLVVALDIVVFGPADACFIV